MNKYYLGDYFGCHLHNFDLNKHILKQLLAEIETCLEFYTNFPGHKYENVSYYDNLSHSLFINNKMYYYTADLKNLSSAIMTNFKTKNEFNCMG